MDSVKKLTNENLKFEIIVTGRSYTFNSSHIPISLKDKFIFKHRVSFSMLCKLVENSDFIIIPFDPKSKYDNLFKKSRVTGSFQLAYGFLKPCLINKEFSEFSNIKF